jgi:CubicO group peptidase (beta-lactamase class C family)
MSSAELQGTLELIRDQVFTKVDSMVVARHGRLVAEGYFNGFGRDSLHDLRSTGKSFTSALAGIAVDQGLFGVDDPISQHIPQFDRHDNMSARKQSIQVYHLLNMNSGLECNDWDSSSRGNEVRMYDKQDWVGFILDLPMAFDPGQATQYCTGGVIVLGNIISRESGMALDAYANSYLFGPLAIRDAEWRRSPDGAATGGGGLRLRPRDAAKLGQLYLDGGPGMARAWSPPRGSMSRSSGSTRSAEIVMDTCGGSAAFPGRPATSTASSRPGTAATTSS